MTPKQPLGELITGPRLVSLANRSALAGLLLWTGCLAAPDPPGHVVSAPSVSSVQSEAQHGPVRAVATLSPAETNLSNPLTLNLRLEWEAGISVPQVDLRSLQGACVIHETHQSLPRREGSRHILEHRIVLEPLQIGQLRLKPLAISFRDRRAGQDEPQVLHTPALPCTITASIDSDELSLALAHHAATAGEPPDHSLSDLPWLLAIVTVLLGTGLLLWQRGRRRRRLGALGPSPEQLADLELERLLADDLLENEVQRFYAELTEIVRRYLERRYRVPARQQTTEEFLQALDQSPQFSSDQTTLLQALLVTADRVKFANLQPTTEELEQSLAWARVFLGHRTDEVSV